MSANVVWASALCVCSVPQGELRRPAHGYVVAYVTLGELADTGVGRPRASRRPAVPTEVPEFESVREVRAQYFQPGVGCASVDIECRTGATH